MVNPITPQRERQLAPIGPQTSPLCNLNRLTVEKITERMGIKDVLDFFGTCRFIWNTYHANAQIWTALFQRRFPHSAIPKELGPFEACKDLHQYHYRLEKGIYTSHFLPRESEVDHTTSFYDSKIIHNAMIYSQGEEGIDVFDLHTGELLKTLTGLGSVRSFTIAGQHLITVSPERTINTYHIESEECLEIRQAPEDWAHFHAIPGGRIFSHQANGFLMQIWDAQEMTLLSTLERPMGLVTSTMHFTRDHLIFGCQDGQIWVANLHNNQFNPFVGHTEQIIALTVGEGKLVSSSLFGHVKIWDISTRECLTSLNLSQKEGATSLVIHEGMLFIGGMHSTISIYDLESGIHLETYEAIDYWDPYGRLSSAHLTFADRQLLLETLTGQIQVRNFNAEYAEVFTEIAERLAKKTYESVQEGLARFDRMPKREKKKVYAEFAKIYNIPPETSPEDLASSFTNGLFKGLKSARVKAINNYLANEEASLVT